MRKLITLLAVSGMTLAASAQMVQSTKATLRLPSREDMSISPVYAAVANQSRNNSTTYNKASTWSGRNVNTVIGTTFFSNQTNGSIYRRIISYKDGKVSATWTAAYSGLADNYFNRGSGYNSMDGSKWDVIPNSRIETYRTGFPSIVTAPDGNNIIFCHLADTGSLSGGFSMSKNSSLGWSTSKVPGSTPPTAYPGALWARVAISGDYMIVVANYTDSSGPTVPNHVTKNGVRSPLVWSRYQISTGNWLTLNSTLPGYDSTLYSFGQADTYSIDANGSTVAIVQGREFQDWAMWKSTDNGATWTKKVILTFPKPKYDFLSDTLALTVCSGGAVHVLVDNNNKVHAFSDRNDVGVDAATLLNNQQTGKLQYQPWFTKAVGSGSLADAILYWNEGKATDSVSVIATSVLVNSVDTMYNFPSTASGGRTKLYSSSSSNTTWPSVAIDSVGTMYLVYSAFTINDDDGVGNYYRDIYVEYSTNGGQTWSNPVNVTSGLGISSEQIYPSVAKLADANIHIQYLSKKNIGNDQNSGTPEVYKINDLMVSTADIKSNTTGSINYVNEVKNNVFSMDQNFPNPFKGITSVPVKLNFSTDVTINVVNLVGQTVFSHKFEKAQSGMNHFQLDLNNLNSGVYFYSVEAEGYKITKRMVVE